jgi:yecA family protein
MPLIFGGRQPPLDENSPELRAVKTIFNRYNEVSETLSDQPQAYRPIFMIDDAGSIVARDWAVGFALGIALRPKEWGESILLTKHRQVLIPILVYCEGELDLLPDMTAAEKHRCQATAHQQIAQAVASARDICNPYRAAEARRQPAKRRRSARIRR